MAEYIERGPLIEICENQGHVDIDDVLSIEVADVAPVVHGRWVKITEARVDTTGFCSVCGEESVWRTYNKGYPLCPYCGAKMNGGKHEAD